MTGLPYDALDPELLLYVHACLVESALLFEQLTVGKLDDAGRQRFHEEQMLAAEMVLIPREIIPPTVPELRAYLRGVDDSGDPSGDGRGAAGWPTLFHEPPEEAEWRPVLKGVSRLAFATLPPGVREHVRVRGSARASGARCGRRSPRPGRCGRSFRPKYRYIAPYQEWRLAAEGTRAAASSTTCGARRASVSTRRRASAARLRAVRRHRRRPARHRRRARRVVGGAARRRRDRSRGCGERRPVPAHHEHDDAHDAGDLAMTLRDAGFDVAPDEIVTAVVATAVVPARAPLRSARASCCRTAMRGRTSTGSQLVGRRGRRRRRARRRVRGLHVRDDEPRLPAG